VQVEAYSVFVRFLGEAGKMGVDISIKHGDKSNNYGKPGELVAFVFAVLVEVIIVVAGGNIRALFKLVAEIGRLAAVMDS